MNSRHLFPITLLLALTTLAGLTPLAIAKQSAAAEQAEEAKSEKAKKAKKADPAAISPLATTGPIPHPITPPSQKEVRAAIERGIEYLLKDQRPEGRWGSAEKTKSLNIYAPAPGAHQGFRLAICGLVLEALIEAEPRLSGDLKKRTAQAIDRGEVWILENSSKVRRAEMEAVYNNWGHAYGTTGLVSLYRRAEGDAAQQEKILTAIKEQVEKLDRYSYLDGGWGYYDFASHTKIPGGSPNSFTTATALLALHQAKSIGVDFPQKKIDAALASIERQRKPDFSFAYGEYLRMRPMYPINRPGGSLGRSQACNLVLRLNGDPRVSDAVLKTWLNRLYARNGWLSIGRKRPVPHESHFGVAGYFYYYGHYYAAHTLELLPEDERPYFQDHLAHILLPLQEKDGTWWDYPFYNYHQQYGTAMAITCLLRCEHKVEPAE